MRRGSNCSFRMAGMMIAAAALCPAVGFAEGDRPTVAVHSAAVDFQPGDSTSPFTLRILGPAGDLISDVAVNAGGSSLAAFRADGSPLADGIYRWEMRARAKATRERSPAEAGGANAAASGWSAHGSFTVRDGAFVAADAAEERGVAATAPGSSPAAGAPSLATFDQVIPDDLIVQGSLCTGFDCVNNENFGFDTIRLKENNLRIKFEDTSVGAFPTTDWQLTANDAESGGANRFSIEDITAARIPFTITGGAASNSIFVGSTGKVGFRTATPVLDLHVNTGDTPALRLEQNGSSGYTAQTWDIAGNEANFFVRDVTGGSRLPLRIRPGAPTSSIDISASGNVGVGTAGPAAKLHVKGTDGLTEMRVEEANATAAQRTMLRMVNNGGIHLLWDRTDAGTNDWQASNLNTSFRILTVGAATPQMILQSSGNMSILGTLTQGSSRTIKENFRPVDGREVLRRLTGMPLSTWNTLADPSQRHLGPVAEDWYATFGFGPDDKHVAISDLSGVALAAIQGLHAELADRERILTAQESRLKALEEQNASLLERLSRLEARRTADQP